MYPKIRPTMMLCHNAQMYSLFWLSLKKRYHTIMFFHNAPSNPLIILFVAIKRNKVKFCDVTALFAMGICFLVVYLINLYYSWLWDEWHFWHRMKIATVKLFNGWMREFDISVAHVPTRQIETTAMKWAVGTGWKLQQSN